jgi:hypothetical protein
MFIIFQMKQKSADTVFAEIRYVDIGSGDAFVFTDPQDILFYARIVGT